MTEKDLTNDEDEVLASYESDEWQSVKNAEAEIARYRQSARATFRKDKRLNIRISTKDLLDLQKRAIRDGIPYQTLISSVLHKYVSGSLIEK